MAWRATRTEPRVSVGNFTQDLEKGQVLRKRTKGGSNHGTITAEDAAYLVENGLLVEVPESAKDNPWFDSDDEELAKG